MFTDPHTQLIVAQQQHQERLERAAHRRLVSSLQRRPSRRRRRTWARGLDPMPDDTTLLPVRSASDATAPAAASAPVDESSTLVSV